MKKLLLLVLSIVFISCSKEEASFDFIIMNINDIYEIDALEGGKIGGMARVETLHKQLLKENPNTLLVHGGDFLNPSLLGTMKGEDGKRFKGKQMIDVMNAMNFDLVAFGNHEFDLKEDELQERLNESTFQWIGTNVLQKGENGLHPFYVEIEGNKTEIPRTKIFHLTDGKDNKLNVGFFSSTINSNPKPYVDYGDLYQDAIDANKRLQQETDIVFGLTHLALHQDKLLAKSVPNVPLILGGHEHTNMMVPVDDAFISKADANAKSAYVHRISYNLTSKKVVINSELILLNETIAPDKEVARKVQLWNVQLDKKLREVLDDPYQVLFTADIPLDGRDKQIRSEQTNLGALITKAMFNAFENVDGAFVNGGSIRIDDELEGAITGVDIFRVLPFGGGINKVEMTGELLEKTLNYGRLKAGTGAYLQLHNVKYNKETKKWRIGGTLIDPNKPYTIVLSDYLLLGLDVPFLSSNSSGMIKVHENMNHPTATDIRKVVIESLKN